MKPYIAIFIALTSSITFAYETTKEMKSARTEKEQPYVSVTPKNTLTKVFKESLLTEAKFKDKEVYRFTYLPTFEKPMTFRLEVTNESQGIIYYTRLSGKGGYELGKIDLTSSKKLNGEEFSKVLKVLREPRMHKTYGNLTTKDVDQLGGLDGSEWYLESQINNKYACTYVWAADSLPRTKAMLMGDDWREEYKKISKQLDPKPFISAYLSLMRSAGYEMDNELGALKPIKKANKAQ